MDEKVRDAQRFINSYNVSAIPKVEEDGKTGWVVMRALTRILQFHLNISTLSDSFGPGTLARLQSDYPVIDGNCINAGINRVVQSALWCKGYNGGEIDGVYGDQVAESVATVKARMGVSSAFPGSGITPKVFKSLLTMDAYGVTSGGSEEIRAIQQWMNGKYISRQDFYIVPCDGNFSRDVQKALMLAIQYQIGIADGAANGVFGPGTQQGIRNNVLAVGSTGAWVQLFTAALVFNKRSGATFSSTFSSTTASTTSAFQNFVRLPTTGKADFQTWASLLISYGDNTRRGTAADCITELTPARIASLRAQGYTAVGRYLCNVQSEHALNKKIQPGELDACMAGGMRVFPIYQLSSNSADYFNSTSGLVHAFEAIGHAERYGFKAGTRIYFAVDFDALDGEVTDYVIPYFRSINNVMRENAPQYSVGIYGARNVCSRVSSAGLSTGSFVLDMSSGYSGNLGFPHPSDWTFDQISTVTVGSGGGTIQIDNNISSGRDAGQSTFEPAPLPTRADAYFDEFYFDDLLATLREYLATWGYGETGGPEWYHAACLYSTEYALRTVLDNDYIITTTCNRLRIPKAIAQSIIFQEMRHVRVDDEEKDLAVMAWHEHKLGPAVTDSSTGIGQIFAATAIRARNYCISQGIIGGDIRDPENMDDIWDIWQELRFDPNYNAATVPLVYLSKAEPLQLPRPSYDTSDVDVQRLFVRYNGVDSDDAIIYGEKVFGYYRIFEVFNLFINSEAGR